MSTTTPFNLVVTNPQLRDLLDLLKKEIMLSLNCHHLGTVQSFDAANQTAVISVNYKQSHIKKLPNGTYGEVLVDYPLLLDCPVVALCGGTTALTFPVQQGDQCIVLFNDRDIDAWFSNNTTSAPPTSRLHSISDGIALVGLNDISGWDAVRALLTNGTVKLGINPQTNKVTFTNGTTLLSILQNLITGILALTAPPGGGTVIDTSGKVGAASTALGNLLE